MYGLLCYSQIQPNCLGWGSPYITLRTETSLIFRKPSGYFHHGGLVSGFEEENPSNRQFYDLFLNWIVEDAREN